MTMRTCTTVGFPKVSSDSAPTGPRRIQRQCKKRWLPLTQTYRVPVHCTSEVMMALGCLAYRYTHSHPNTKAHIHIHILTRNRTASKDIALQSITRHRSRLTDGNTITMSTVHCRAPEGIQREFKKGSLSVASHTQTKYCNVTRLPLRD